MTRSGAGMAVTFRIDIEPRGKGRPRFGNGRTFTDPKTKAYETAIGFAARAAMGGKPPMNGPIHLHVTAFMPMPKKMPPERRGRPTTTPDADNLLKALSDACNKIVWHDDAQIVEATILKQYSTAPALVVVARPV
jgi:Holliday junction resolvase RusA-like endonuclease